MIVKELEQIESGDKFVQAGYNAEAQMAFYLKRAFKDDPQLLIFNNLRLEKEGDACQIDHLVLHPYGMILIESKSVTTRVRVNELGEWTRWIDEAMKGMPSPILQAQRQGEFLRGYLEENVESLRNKKLIGGQSHFIKMPIDILVAISDSGIIDRPKNDKLDCVWKAERIADRIKEIYKAYLKADGIFVLSLTLPFSFDKDELPKISQFLVAAHKPLKPQVSQIPQAEKQELATPPLVISPQLKIQPKIQPTNIAKSSAEIPSAKPIIATKEDAKKLPVVSKKPIPKPAKPTEKYICSHCQSQNLAVQYAHSYFFKCLDCQKNTAIKHLCPTCGDREKTRKSGLEFFTECEKCNTSRLFYNNPVLK